MTRPWLDAMRIARSFTTRALWPHYNRARDPGDRVAKPSGTLSYARTRRVADWVQRLTAGEAALRAAEVAIKEASGALRDLRALGEQGG